jgi:photosystem II stability/assembly factor-like uncharacterized protein
MKKIIPAVILLSCFCTVIKAQSSGWFFINPQPTNMTLNDVIVLNQSKAIAVGYYGTVLRTTNGGLNWCNPLSLSAITGLERLNYFKINFFDENTGLVLGNNASGIAKIFKTTNMGVTWSFVAQLTGYQTTMYFLNLNTGWIESAGRIIKTTNGGSNWQSSFTAFPPDITSIIFLNALNGFAAASNKIFFTSDGGTNWNVVNSSAPHDSRLCFMNSQTGFACGSGSIIQKTTNSGVTWITKLSNSATGTLSSIYFINTFTGFAVGGGFGNPPACTYRSTDAGETWNQITVYTTYHLNSVGFSGNLGLIVGYGGRVARSTDQGLSWSVSPSFHQPNLGFFPLCFINANTGWMSIDGYTGPVSIYKSTNGGLNWVIIYTVSPYPDWIQFLDGNTGYYKRSNTLHKSTNGGYNWIQLPPLNISVSSIKFVDVNTGWACGCTYTPIKPKVIKTINGGNSWDTIPVPLDYSAVTAFNFINDNTGWISKAYATYPMGTYSKIFRTTNAGQNWVDLRTDTNMNYKKISFLNNLTGWASGNNCFIKTTNGGNNWINLPVNVLGAMFQFIDANTGWAEDIMGSIYKTTNGGLNWYSQVDIGLAGVMNMQFINQETGWIVGDEGLIIKTTNGGEPVGIHSISKENEISKNYFLFQNYPNPFNPATTIRFDIPPSRGARGMIVKLFIYDILGREITTLVNEQLKPGTYEAEWDGSNYSSGVYFYKLSINNEQLATKKMVLIK